MTQSSIIEQSRRYPTQAEIAAAMERAHQIRAETFGSILSSLARAFSPHKMSSKQETAVRLPQPVRAAHS